MNPLGPTNVTVRDELVPEVTVNGDELATYVVVVLPPPAGRFKPIVKLAIDARRSAELIIRLTSCKSLPVLRPTVKMTFLGDRFTCCLTGLMNILRLLAKRLKFKKKN